MGIAHRAISVGDSILMRHALVLGLAQRAHPCRHRATEVQHCHAEVTELLNLEQHMIGLTLRDELLDVAFQVAVILVGAEPQFLGFLHRIGPRAAHLLRRAQRLLNSLGHVLRPEFAKRIK